MKLDLMDNSMWEEVDKLIELYGVDRLIKEFEKNFKKSKKRYTPSNSVSSILKDIKAKDIKASDWGFTFKYDLSKDKEIKEDK